MSKLSFINLQRSLPSVQHRSVSQRIPIPSNTIDVNNLDSSHLMRNSCMNVLDTHPRTAYAFSTSDIIQATVLNASLVSKRINPFANSTIQRPQVFTAFIATSTATSNRKFYPETVNTYLRSPISFLVSLIRRFRTLACVALLNMLSYILTHVWSVVGPRNHGACLYISWTSCSS
jgi:hypothetical protein